MGSEFSLTFNLSITRNFLIELSVELRVRGPELKEPVLIAALPGAGLAGLIAVDHIVRTLQMVEIGFADSTMFPPIVGIEKGKAYHPIRVFVNEKEKIYAIKGEIPIPGMGIVHLTSSVMDWIDRMRPKLVILPDGVGVHNRLDIEKPRVFKAFNMENVAKLLENVVGEVLEHGYISGFPAIMLREAERRGIPAATLIVQCFPTYPDPGAAVSLLEAISQLIGVKIEVSTLEEKSEQLRMKLRELMDKTAKVTPILPGYVG